ncbi:MAG: glycosyltransferase family 4 protein [Microthrixaceae bacterium]
MALLVSLVLTASITPLLARLALRIGVVDHPGPLKIQVRPVPYLGGVAVLAGLVAPTVATRPSLAIPMGAAALLGLADDLRDLPPGGRLLVEGIIGLLVAVVVDVSWPWWPLAAIVTVTLINAVNLLDGLDGLASGVALVSALGFVIVLDGAGRTIGWALAGALAGFLLWNRPPARIYLGDAGSYLIGTALATLFATTTVEGGSASVAAAAVLLLGVPVGDAAVAIVRRARARRPLFSGDRGHVYDQLIARGWSPERASIACVAAQAMLAALAAIVARRSGGVAMLVVSLTVASAGLWSLRTFTGPSGWRTNLPGTAQ